MTHSANKHFTHAANTSVADQNSADPRVFHPEVKQAVVVIHGMGKQRPMDTIKDFVKAVWVTDRRITATDWPNPNGIWSKPDARTGSHELRRITTRHSIPSAAFPTGVRSDFYELYWADLTAGSPFKNFVGWIMGLLWRRPSRVPRGVRPAWILLWILSAVVVVLTIPSWLPNDAIKALPAPVAAWVAAWQLPLLLTSLVIGPLVYTAATETFGRVVRYTCVDPDNIAARRNVRERGMALLSALHDKSYKRIILVSHSLGSMLAYDLLNYFWASREAARQFVEGSPEFEALCHFEIAAGALGAAPTAEALHDYYQAQRCLRRALASRPAPAPVAADRSGTADTRSDTRWLISDLVTVGSPLTHAEFLIANSSDDLTARKQLRELPTSPPLREQLDPDIFRLTDATGKLPVGNVPETSYLTCFPVLATPGVWELHHAAPFAAVRWTNIHDSASLLALGDFISGPVRHLFGPAIVDIDLKPLRGQARGFTHTRYWAMPEQGGAGPAVDALRWAVNLLDDERADQYEPNRAASPAPTPQTSFGATGRLGTA